MAETFADNATTTLASAIPDGTTASIQVNSAALFPSTGNFRIIIDSEIMIVQTVTGNNFAVLRGQEGTTAVNHAAGATVAHVFTSGAAGQFLQKGAFIQMNGDSGPMTITGGYLNSGYDAAPVGTGAITTSMVNGSINCIDSFASGGVDEPISTHPYEAFSFVARAPQNAPNGQAFYIVGFSLSMKSPAPTANGKIAVSLRQDNAGLPAGPGGIYATGNYTFNVNALGAGYGTVYFAIPATQLTVGTKYWIVLQNTVIGGSYFCDSSNTVGTNIVATSNDGSTWTSSGTKSLVHQVHYTTHDSIVTTTTGGRGIYSTSYMADSAYFSTVNGYGVNAQSIHGPAIFANSNYNVGALLYGRLAPLQVQIQSISQVDYNTAGQIIWDNQGKQWVCLTSGVPGKWFAAGSVKPLASKNASATLTSSDEIVIATQPSLTFTLPSPSSTDAYSGKVFTIINGVAGTTTINAASGTINGGASTTLTTQYSSASFVTDGTNWFTVYGGTGGGGSVTSVGLSLPSDFTVTGSPVTTSGTLTATRTAQSANQVFAGPASGAAAPPTYRSLVSADLPIATASILGGVKAGAGIAVAGDGTITTSLAGDTDVTLTSPASGQDLIYDSTSGKWVNNAAPDIVRAYASTYQALTAGNWTSAPLDVNDYDPNALHSTSVNPTRITAKRNGVYLLTGAATFDVGSGTRGIRIVKNGATTLDSSTLSSINGSVQFDVGNQGYLLSSGDYIEIQLYSDSTVNTVAGTVVLSALYIAWVPGTSSWVGGPPPIGGTGGSLLVPAGLSGPVTMTAGMSG